MKIVFLDFDGVLNNSSSMYVRMLDAKNDKEGFMSIAAADPICVRLVDHLIDKTDAKIVVSSSWRQGRTVDELKTILQNEFGLRNWDKVISKTRPTRSTGVTEAYDIRGNQIADWLNPYVVDKYVILDDDSDMLDSQADNHVHTSYTNGFTVHDLDKAFKILGIPNTLTDYM